LSNPKERLDKVLVSRGLVKSRELARALVIEGRVYVEGAKTTKAGTLVRDDANITVKEQALPFVGRGGLKLEAALDFFGVDAEDKIAMDVGASTGGFTDCLLQRGARKVFALDVGYGQLAWQLRNDPRVVVMERINVRYLGDIIESRPNDFRGTEFKALTDRDIDLAVIDVSFISLKIIVPVTFGFLKSGGKLLALLKPQFEAGKGEVGKGGIVREEEKRLRILEGVVAHFRSTGISVLGAFESPVSGQKGNREYFLYMKKEQVE
jgi:23S rRNA (cytidine1920-2'-O)/16S rRNA (cytidine1409-2'-O)-methyltransferase